MSYFIDTKPADDGRAPIEPGEAFVRWSHAATTATDRRSLPTVHPATRERFDVLVIGGGQAGLSVGHHLAQRGLRFAILDANRRIGDSWRQRWDSLRLFTPAKFDGLAGMPFPAPPDSFPTKDDMASYLEAYAKRFSLPVRTGARVDRLWCDDGRYVVQSGTMELEADQVVVAMSNYQRPRVPGFAEELDDGIVQLHSSEYRDPSQLQEGSVLVVGAANSGAEIALELSKSHDVRLSGRHPGHLPFRVEGLWGRLFLVRLVLRVLFHRLLTVRTPLGRKIRPKVLSCGGPLIRQTPRRLAEAQVERVPRVIGAKDGLPQLQDGRIMDVKNVVWCTGFDPGFSWIDLPIFGNDGEPQHDGGIAKDAPGLYFVGLHFLYSVSSVMIHGVSRDAARIAAEVGKRVSERSNRWHLEL